MLPWRASFSRRAARRAKVAGNWNLAAQLYGRAIEQDPRSAGTWVQYGNALRECGKFFEAEAVYRRSLELDDRDPDAHVQLGHLLKHQRRGDEAIRAYLRALDIDPWLLDASQELIDLGWIAHLKPPECPPRRHSEESPRDATDGARNKTTPVVIIDASDLLLHFQHARLPTGIQRVQLHIIASLLTAPSRDIDLLLACFAPHLDFWVAVPDGLFAALARLAMSGGGTDERPWQRVVLDLRGLLVHGDRIEFPTGAVLVNLGASWSHPNYFLKLRNVKADHGIRYIPFVHDCIPVLMPEHCVEATVQNYIDWLLGLFIHADGYLVNSKSTGQDLAKVAGLLGHPISLPHVVPLDGSFAADDKPDGAKALRSGHRHRQYGSVNPFVLFVSTFEPRKNHLLAFTLWLKLIEARGMRRTPRLICVGHRRWKVEEAMSLLRSNKALQRRVQILTGIADADLAELYRGCLFTFYPSLYEGWGLPITESLCYGKVPLISATSSLPEAGGELAEYFDINSHTDILEKIERLIDDREYRMGREALIKEKFKPRNWRAIADQVIDYALTRQSRATTSPDAGRSGEIRDVWAPPIEIGRYYAITRGRETSIRSGMVAGEMYRTGDGWWLPDEWGCWLKEAQADIAFSLPELADRTCLLYLGLRGIPSCRSDFELSLRENGIVRCGTLEPDQYQWPMLRIEPKANRGAIQLRMASNQSCNLAEFSGGIDRRVVTLGVVGLYLCAENSSNTAPDFMRNNTKPEMMIEGTGGVTAE